MLIEMETGKPEIVSEDKQIERLLENTFAGLAVTQRLVHQTRKYEVSILSVAGRPEPELSTLATIGLWRTLLTGPKTVDTSRLELVGIFESAKDGCREILATAAYKIMRTHKQLVPGSAFQDCVHDWYPKANVPHLYFVEAAKWSFPRLRPSQMGNLNIHFLQALPITQSEFEYLQEHGNRALESKFLAAAVNHWDFKRKACV